MKLKLTPDELLSGNNTIEKAIEDYYASGRDVQKLYRVMDAVRIQKDEGTRFLTAALPVQRRIVKDGKPVIQHAIMLNPLKGSNGKTYAGVFTSESEGKRPNPNDPEQKSPTVLIPIADVFAMVLGNPSIDGLMINPWGQPLILTRKALETINAADEKIKKEREARAAVAAARQKAVESVADRLMHIADAGITGAIVGDVLGVPVEFKEREELASDPVTDLRGFGTHNQPKGSWSDDSSMILCEADSLVKQEKLDFADIMENFFQWKMYGKYTPSGESFGIGNTTASAIMRYSASVPVLKCGLTDEDSCGNGSLMRILPFALLIFRRGHTFDASDREMLHEASALTHAHPRCMLGCEIYSLMIRSLFRSIGVKDKAAALQEAINDVDLFYRGPLALKDEENESEEDKKSDEEAMENHREFVKDYDAVRAEFGAYSRLTDIASFAELPESEIKSTGYIVDTLEAAVWCFINTDSYKDCVLKAVNLGGDTDTIASVAGGLAGIYYGRDSIPQEWRDAVIKKDEIAEIIASFQKKWIA